MNEESIFLEALKKEAPGERAAFLDQACAGDADLRRSIDMLLHAHAKAGRFLHSVPEDGRTMNEAALEGPGTVIGPYKLLEQIGEGGFGVVYMAEQQEPIRRKVALKVLKPGMDSRQVIARFEAERQALALMDHPNIARVFDAGTTGSGRPYFVMELVKGIPLTDFCDQGQLGVCERLGLFVSVCQAVQHAHQKGVIHRDIKPSNVLVTLHDGVPVVKVIDFGIAKALGQQLTDKTLFTGFAQLVGTPLYMSPEQAALSGLDVDTRSDIYSLGVLLYELLTGTTPFDRERLKEVGFDELRRIIREEEPPKPSTRISTLGQAATTVSAQRQSDPKRLSRLFRGELDWIVMKALEKDRSRRYETASAFAADVERYLADEPVLACPPSARYLLGKLARRHKVALTTAWLVTAALLLGTAGSLWQAHEARQAQAWAQAELEEKDRQFHRAEDNVQLSLQSLEQIYADLAGRRLREEPHLELLRKEYMEKLLGFYIQFADKNRGHPTVRLETAKAARRVADIRYELGQLAEAEQAYRGAIPMLEALAGVASPPREPRAELADCLEGLAFLRRATRRPDLGEETLKRVLVLRRDLRTEAPSEWPYQRALANTYGNLGLALWDQHRLPEAEAADRQAIQLLQPLADRLAKVSDLRMDLATAQANLAVVLHESNRLKEAAEAFGRARLLQEKVLERWPNVPRFRFLLSFTCNNFGMLLYKTRRPKEAEEAFRQAVSLRRKLAVDFPAVAKYRQELVGACNNLYRLLAETGRGHEVRPLFDQLLALRPDAPEYRQAQANFLNDQAMRTFNQGRAGPGEDLLRQSLAVHEKLVKEFPKEPGHWRYWASALQNLAVIQVRTGRAPQAEESFRQALSLYRGLFDQLPAADRDRRGPALADTRPAPDLSSIELGPVPDYRQELAVYHANLAHVLSDLHKYQEAEQLYRDGLKTVPESWQLKNDLAWLRATCPDSRFAGAAEAVSLAGEAVQAAPKAAKCWNTLGVAHYRAGHWQEAIKALTKCMDLSKGGDASDWFFLAMAHERLGHKEEARQWFERAVRWLDKHHPGHELLRHFRAEAAELLAVENNKN
jgi:serine/threonine protein kinase/tetratricopeptide (TPR) repeat protein